MFGFGKKKQGDEENKELREKREMELQLVEQERDFIEENMPKERAQIAEMVRLLSNEAMEYKQRIDRLEAELKQAVRRKKGLKDPLLGKYALVLFSLPKVKRGNEKNKVRMHTVDNVKGQDVINTVRRLMKDRDNQFVGAYVLMEMRGKEDAYERLRKNAEGAWHLFECLNGDLEKYDPEKKEDHEDNPYEHHGKQPTEQPGAAEDSPDGVPSAP